MPDPTASTALTRAALADLSHELATTRRLLERVPDEHLAWRPHAKSFSLGELAAHIANLLFWQLTAIEGEGFDLASVPPRIEPPSSGAEVLRDFDDRHAAVKGAMERLRDAALEDTWTLRRGEQVIFRQPRLAVIRGMGINHLIHHRGQLSVYLRLLDVPLPPMYGPTADEAV